LYVVGAAHAGLSTELVLGTAVVMAGAEAARPAASLAGRLYFATDTLRTFRDTGAAWVTIGVQALLELTERAHSSLTGVGVDDHHARDHAIDGATHSGTLDHADLSVVTANQHHNQAHDVDGADHTQSGGTAGRFLRETGAATIAFEAIAFSAGATILTPAAATFVMVWRAPFACTVTNVRGHRKGGTGATVNARRNQASDHLASDLSLTSADTWMDGGAVQNTAYIVGDDLEVEVATVAGSPTEVAVQVDYTRP
jgi:hypothetical protein